MPPVPPAELPDDGRKLNRRSLIFYTSTNTTHAVDVVLPAAPALGGAFMTLGGGGAKYFGTLFLDSQDNIPLVNGCTYQASVSSTLVRADVSSVPILVVTQTG